MKKEDKRTHIWTQLERGKQYNILQQMYSKGKTYYDNYHGRQWEGLKKPKSDSEVITLNIIKPIIKYKVNIVNQNHYEIVFNPNSYNTEEELETLKSVSKGLSQFLNRMWEKSQSGKKVRSIVKNACINAEGIIYFYKDELEDQILSEEIDKNNIYYGNENESDIQNQPYILVTFRKTVQEVKDLARLYRDQGYNNLSDDEIEEIVSDKDIEEEQASDKRLMEIMPMCTIVKKFERKEDGIIYVSEATSTCDLITPQSTECKLYPFAHFLWEEELGYARGVSEVENLIDNQREINKTATRRAIAVKIGAYPKLVADTKYVKNPDSLTGVGSLIELYDMRADNVNNVVSYLRPTSMSGDAYNLQADLINTTKDLAGAGDTATGNVDPTQASGKAILAVQQASQQPLNEQLENYKYFLEDCAKILFELIKVYFVNGLILYTTESQINDLGQAENIEKPFKISKSELAKVNLDLKIDITPCSPYDRYALELSLENLLLKNLITLEEYAEALPDNSSSAKTDLENIIRKRKEARQKIAEMQAQAEALYGAVQQEMIAQEGAVANEMPEMQNGGNDSNISQTEQVQTPM
mgnify:CR=1 FL=1